MLVIVLNQSITIIIIKLIIILHCNIIPVHIKFISFI